MKFSYKFMLVILSLFIIVGIFAYYYSKYINTPYTIFKSLEKEGHEVAVHRVNIESKLLELKNMGIKNIEIDVHIHDQKLIVGHEAETSIGQSLENYLQSIENINPSYTFIWLDIKDLTEKNQDIIFNKLEFLDKKFHLKNRVLIESRYVNALKIFNLNGWKTGYYLEYELNTQPDTYIKNVINDLNRTKSSAITFNCKYIDFAYEKFLKIKLDNGENISLNCWDTTKKIFSKSDLKKIRNIDRILIAVDTINNL